MDTYQKTLMYMNETIQDLEAAVVMANHNNFVGLLDKQCKFSLETYGPGSRVEGVIAHITKELEEIRLDPSDPKEWIDVAILAFDGCWRASGLGPQEIWDAYVAKLEKNMSRKWPDWRTADPNAPIEHIKGIND